VSNYIPNTKSAVPEYSFDTHSTLIKKFSNETTTETESTTTEVAGQATDLFKKVDVVTHP